MKLLQDFKQQPIIEEEKSDYSKFDMLVRAGLANKAQLQRIHRILDKMKDERPVFNNADRMILQNLFNRMVDIISNNKQIFQQTRRVVREDVELDETELDTADYKISKTGRKVRAHRFKIGEENEPIEAEDLTEQKDNKEKDPPFVLMLKRKAIRLYPNNTRIALYYNQKLNKYFSVPYGNKIDSPIQSEEVIEESVIDQLHNIVAGKQKQSVKFGNGQSRSIDHYTASAITQVHKALNDENKKKFADMVHKSPAHLAKAADFAFSKVKK
jgi:hypothetical protein